MLLAALPLADEPRRDVEVTREHGLAGLLARSDPPDLNGAEPLHGREAELDEPDQNGVYVLVDKVESNNGKPDCMGQKTPIRDIATVYVTFSTTGDEMFVCYDEAMRRCFSMKRVPDV